MLRTDALARLLLGRLLALGPMSESEALDALEARAPGRGEEVIAWAIHMGAIRRVPGDPVRLEAAGAPRIAA